MTDAQFPPVPKPPTNWQTGTAQRITPPLMPSLASLNPAAPGDPAVSGQYAPEPFAPAPYTGAPPTTPPQQYAPTPHGAPMAPHAPIANPYAVQSRPVTVPTLGALVPFAALLAIVGAVTPWFAPIGTIGGVRELQARHALFSWKDGRVGLIAPIALTILGIGVVALMRGRTSGRLTRRGNPLSSAGTRAMWVSVISAGGLAAAWAFVPHQYRMPASVGGSWDGAQNMGIEMSRNPQIGFYLTVAAVALAFVGGISLKAAGKRS